MNGDSYSDATCTDAFHLITEIPTLVAVLFGGIKPFDRVCPTFGWRIVCGCTDCAFVVPETMALSPGRRELD